MNDTQLIERLAQADSYSDGAELPDGIWTLEAALQEIERRAGMQTQKQVGLPTPPPKKTPRRWIPAIASFAAAVAAIVVVAAIWASSSDEPDVGGRTPLEVGEALNSYAIAGDWEAARLLYADGATYTNSVGFGLGGVALNVPMAETIDFPEPEYVDWDGDGSITLFDEQAALMKESYATGVTRFLSCSQTDPSTVVCDLPYEGYAFRTTNPILLPTTYTVVEGRITSQTLDASEMEGWYYDTNLRIEYQEWVRTSEPDLEGDLFRSFGSPSITPDNIETHRELIAEWRAQR